MLVFFQNYIICAQSFFFFLCVGCVQREKVSGEKEKELYFLLFY